tara:strand:+ start:25998 stop:26633 length:636 start_codon:yes stop_codon:yes gene_type:complete
MAITNYTELKAAVASWITSDALTAQIPDFIQFAEIELNAELRNRDMQVDETLTLTSGTSTVSLPSRFIDPISLELVISGEDNTPLTYVKPHDIIKNISSAARPQHWTINGSYIEFPNPSDQTYTLSFRMLKGYDIASTTTNTLLTKYPLLYLYGALAQGAIFAREDQRMGLFAGQYSKMLLKVKKAEARVGRLVNLRTEFANTQRSNIIAG